MQIEVMQAKSRFVDNELTAVLRSATRGFVRECWYEHVSGGVELVHVALGEDASVIDVNVACDSEWAILKDVTKAVARYY